MILVCSKLHYGMTVWRRRGEARRPVSRVLSRLAAGMTIHLGRPLPDASRDLPGRRRGEPAWAIARPTVPMRSCSRWGLPCRPRCRGRGALLPHPFTLAASERGGLLSVALSLGSPPPGVTRHRVSVEPGLSSIRASTNSGHPAVWPDSSRNSRRPCQTGGTAATSAVARRRVSPSGSPSNRAGRKWRWNADSTCRVVGSRMPVTATP